MEVTLFMQCCELNQLIFDVTNINLNHLITSGCSNMTELLQRFKRFADLYSDTTYIHNFGSKQSVKYLKQNCVDTVQVSIKNEDEYINLLDAPIEQKEIAFSFVVKQKIQGELFEEYDLDAYKQKE